MADERALTDRDKLTEYEAALVFRRAAELDERPADRLGGFDESALLQAAEEAGLSPAAVQQALAELRLGTIPTPSPRRRLGRRRADRGIVQIRREVRAPKDEVEHAVASLLSGEKFVVRRRPAGGSTVWDRSGQKRKSPMRRVDAVSVAVAAQGDHACLVHVDLDLRKRGQDVVTSSATAAAFGAGGPALLIAMVGAEPWTLLTVPFGLLMAGSTWRSERASYEGHRSRAADAIELLLDELDCRRPRD